MLGKPSPDTSHVMNRSCSYPVIVTVTSYLPIGRSPNDSRSMWMTNVSPTAPAGSPLALCNMPDASIATWPRGSHTTRKMVAASAGMVRWTSNRSSMAGIMSPRAGVRVVHLARPVADGGDRVGLDELRLDPVVVVAVELVLVAPRIREVERPAHV